MSYKRVVQDAIAAHLPSPPIFHPNAVRGHQITDHVGAQFSTYLISDLMTSDRVRVEDRWQMASEQRWRLARPFLYDMSSTGTSHWVAIKWRETLELSTPSKDMNN